MSNKSLGMYGESFSEQQLADYALIREYSLKYNREQEKRKTTGLIVKITFLVATIF